MGNYQTAIELTQLGLAVFPCEESGETRKRPKPGVRWKQASGDDPERVRVLWNSWQEAVPGVDLAKAGLLVIDCDRKPGQPDGVEAFTTLCDEVGFDLSGVPQVITPSGGMHFYFRQISTDEPHGNAKGDLPAGIDVRGAGGYVIGPGARFTDDGTRYEMASDVEISEAPVVPDWLLAHLKAGKQRQEHVPPAIGAQPYAPSGSGREAAYIAAAMTREIDLVRTAPQGTRNQALNDAALKLGHYVGGGLLTENEVRHALISAAMASGLAKDDGLKQCEATIRSGLSKGMAEPKGIPEGENDEAAQLGAQIAGSLAPKPTLIEHDDGTLMDAQTGEVIEPVRPSTNDNVDVDLPPGLVGEVAQWICETARQPNPVLALAAALSVVGTAAGRQFASPTVSGTHLYIVGIGVSGAGKDHVLKAAERLLEAADCSHHVIGGGFASSSAVNNAIAERPLLLCIIDEFGGFLGKVLSPKESGWQRGVADQMRTLWGTNFSNFRTQEYAGKSSILIRSPHFSMLTATTPAQFFRTMQGASIEDGTFNRFLLMDSGDWRADDRQPPEDVRHVPATLRLTLKAIYDHSGPLIASQRNQSSLEPDPVCLAWGKGAEDVWTAFKGDLQAKRDKNDLTENLAARTAEMALRIATIVAVGRRSMSVDADDLTFGILLASRSLKAMIKGAQEHMAETPLQANVKKAQAFIFKKSAVSRTQLVKHMQGAIRARDLDDVITILLEAGAIEKTEGVAKNGNSVVFYKAIKGQQIA